MSTNARAEYFAAEKRYLDAKNLEEKVYWLEEMIREAPRHKGSENMLAELRSRLKRLREKLERASIRRPGGKRGIRKEGFQCVLVGLPGRGKSLLLSRLTRARPKVSSHGFTTITPEIGTFEYEGVKAQMIDMPSIGHDGFSVGIVNGADCLLIVVEGLEELKVIEGYLIRARGARIVVVNKSDLFSGEGLRRFEERLRSKRIYGVLVSAVNGYGLDVLRRKIFERMGVVRVYTKEPGKAVSHEPVVLPVGASVRDVAERILKGFSLSVRETRLTGSSGKFPNQLVGLDHRLHDKDIVEFHTR